MADEKPDEKPADDKKKAKKPYPTGNPKPGPLTKMYGRYLEGMDREWAMMQDQMRQMGADLPEEDEEMRAIKLQWRAEVELPAMARLEQHYRWEGPWADTVTVLLPVATHRVRVWSVRGGIAQARRAAYAEQAERDEAERARERDEAEARARGLG